MVQLPAKSRLVIGTGLLITLAAGCGWGASATSATTATNRPVGLAGPARADTTTTTLAPPTTIASSTTTVAPPTTPTTVAPTTIPPTTIPPTTIPPTTTPTTVAPTTIPTTVAPTTTTATAPPLAAPTATVVGPSVPEGSVLMVGDSVTIDAAPYLQPAGVTVNGEVGRQFSEGIGLVANIAAAHQLPPTLVVALGTNGTVTSTEMDQMVQAASGARHIVFVTIDVPRSWEVGDNQVIEAAPARYPGLVTVANWYAVASAHPEWFTEDQVHLQPPGAQALAAFVLAAVA
jgi:hypothetical protein